MEVSVYPRLHSLVEDLLCGLLMFLVCVLITGTQLPNKHAAASTPSHPHPRQQTGPTESNVAVDRVQQQGAVL